MNLEEFQNADKIMTLLWKNKDTVFEWEEILSFTNLSANEANDVMQLILADGNAISPYKPANINNPNYIITNSGFSFFSRSNYTEEAQRKNKDHQLNFTMNNFHNISNSTIYNQSTFTNAFNKTKNSDEAMSIALDKLKDIIQTSGSVEASELFDTFNEEISKENPKKSVMKSLWGGLVAALPQIETALDIFDKVQEYLN